MADPSKNYFRPHLAMTQGEFFSALLVNASFPPSSSLPFFRFLNKCLLTFLFVSSRSLASTITFVPFHVDDCLKMAIIRPYHPPHPPKLPFHHHRDRRKCRLCSEKVERPGTPPKKPYSYKERFGIRQRRRIHPT